VATRALVGAFDLPDTPVTALALFHTVFNVLNVVLIWPVAGRLIRWLQQRFVSAEENEAQPRYLDRTSVHVPQLAVESLVRELQRLAAISTSAAAAAIAGTTTATALAARQSVVDRLSAAIMDYARQLGGARIPVTLADALVHPLRMVQHAMEMVRLGIFVHARRSILATLPGRLADESERLRLLVARCLARFADAGVPLPDEETEALSREVEDVYQGLKTRLLEAGAQGGVSTVTAEEAITVIDALGHRTLKASRRLALLERSLARGESTSAELIGENDDGVPNHREL